MILFFSQGLLSPITLFVGDPKVAYKKIMDYRSFGGIIGFNVVLRVLLLEGTTMIPSRSTRLQEFRQLPAALVV